MKLLTWNLMMFPKEIPGKSWFNTLERIKRVAEYLEASDVDIVVLNELFDLQAVRYLRTHLTKLVHWTPLLMSHKSGRMHGTLDWLNAMKDLPFSKQFMNGGVVLVSRFPIVDMDQHWYRAGWQIDKYSAKGFIYCGLETPEGRVDVIATHMQASYDHENVGIESVSCRKHQVQEIKHYLTQKAIPSNRPVLLAGDLNMDKDSIEFQELLKEFQSEKPVYTTEQPSFDAKNGFHMLKSEPIKSLTLDIVVDINTKTQSLLAVLPIKTKQWRRLFLGVPFGDPLDEYSDHYPVECIFALKRCSLDQE
ncbi:Endonuclease/exonuclease/phosphatase [Gorgonomyces haynaldii]|nr:Endonuclease/exonuclease/phosphatase [Gorgonomyces haynaldii]